MEFTIKEINTELLEGPDNYNGDSGMIGVSVIGSDGNKYATSFFFDDDYIIENECCDTYKLLQEIEDETGSNIIAEIKSATLEQMSETMKEVSDEQRAEIEELLRDDFELIESNNFGQFCWRLYPLNREGMRLGAGREIHCLAAVIRTLRNERELNEHAI